MAFAKFITIHTFIYLNLGVHKSGGALYSSVTFKFFSDVFNETKSLPFFCGDQCLSQPFQ